jgi:hypothetical protein
VNNEGQSSVIQVLYRARIKIRGNVCRVTNEGGLRLFVLEAAVQGPDQEQGPGRCNRWAEPMMQRKLCGVGRGGFSAPLNCPIPAKLSKFLSAGFEVGPLRDRPKFEESRGLAGYGIGVCNREWQQK